MEIKDTLYIETSEKVTVKYIKFNLFDFLQNNNLIALALIDSDIYV